MNRDAKDFAIEFGEYLAKAAEQFQDVIQAELAGQHDQDVLSDTWRALESAIYEFRKRKERAAWCNQRGDMMSDVSEGNESESTPLMRLRTAILIGLSPKVCQDSANDAGIYPIVQLQIADWRAILEQVFGERAA